MRDAWRRQPDVIGSMVIAAGTVLSRGHAGVVGLVVDKSAPANAEMHVRVGDLLALKVGVAGEGALDLLPVVAWLSVRPTRLAYPVEEEMTILALAVTLGAELVGMATFRCSQAWLKHLRGRPLADDREDEDRGRPHRFWTEFHGPSESVGHTL